MYKTLRENLRKCVTIWAVTFQFLVVHIHLLVIIDMRTRLVLFFLCSLLTATVKV